MGFLDGRKQEKEIQREIKFKQGLSKVRIYIDKCKQAQKTHWQLGKCALELGDRQQFENMAKAYLRTGDMITRWERYLVTMEAIPVQRDQVKATREFTSSMKALTESMMPDANPKDISKMQMDLEKALTRAKTLDETLSAVMDATSDMVFSSEGLSEESVQQVESAMKGESEHEASAAVTDDNIADELKRVEGDMKKETK